MKPLKNSCNIGEIGESAFMHAAIARGMSVSQPFGHGCPYDFIIDVQGTLIKVQVKTSAWRKLLDGRTSLSFKLNARGRGVRSVASRFDILVGYDRTLKDFYIIPAKNITTNDLSFCSKTKPYIFKNNWSLLLPPSTK